MKNIVNIINFIRGIEPRPGRNIDLVKPVREQIRIMKELHICGTFLVQYDALLNEEIVALLKGLPEGFEIGLWLETVQPQVEAAGIKWRGRFPWDWHNDVGFLIGYSPEERKRLIDVHADKFKEVFGIFPKVVGSWHIDAASMLYLSEKYGVDACCICRDQIGTDGYTLQGGYYNQAYYPCKNNMFSPAQTKKNQIDMPVFRMLGSSAAFAYDFQLCDYDGVHKTIPTLEPVQLARNNEWGEFLLGEIFGGKGLAFQYAQIGQENSFGWDNMRDGIEFQFKKVAEMAKNGLVEILTLGESGRWYKENFSLTPATAYVADKKWQGNDVRSYWYESRYYRVNFFLENGVLRMRDLYLFNEKFQEKYLKTKCASAACEYRNLPVFDGALYSNEKKNVKAGCYFYCGENPVLWNRAEYAENGTSVILSLYSDFGHLRIELEERKIKADTDIENSAIISVYDRENVYGKNGNDNRTFANHNGDASLSYIRKAVAKDGVIEFLFDGFSYSVTFREGTISDDFAVTPKNGKIVAVMS